jgi:hypothetical protein
VWGKQKENDDMVNYPQQYQNHLQWQQDPNNNTMGQNLCPSSTISWEIQNRLFFQKEAAWIEVQKREAMSEISVQESKAKAQIRSDLASQREMQSTTTFVRQDGTVVLCKEQFGKEIKGKLPIKIHFAKRLRCMGRPHEADILLIQVGRDDRQHCDLLFRSNKLEEKFIRRQFDKAGISFGFKARKEQEVKRNLILYLLGETMVEVIPIKHGWYQREGAWFYAFPEEITWKEIETWI